MYQTYSWFFRGFPSILRKFVGWVLSYLFTCYGVIIFGLYDPRDVLYYLNCQNWSLHVVSITFFMFTQAPAGKKIEKYVKEQRELEKERKDAATDVSDAKKEN